MVVVGTLSASSRSSPIVSRDLSKLPDPRLVRLNLKRTLDPIPSRNLSHLELARGHRPLLLHQIRHYRHTRPLPFFLVISYLVPLRVISPKRRHGRTLGS